MTLGAALSLGAFLLFVPAAFVLLPLGLLLFWSGGIGMRWPALFAATFCAVMVAIWLGADGGLSEQVLKAWTVATTGAFLLFVFGAGRRSIDAALLAALTGAAMASLWLFAYHVPFQSVLDDGVRGFLASYRQLSDVAPSWRPMVEEATRTIPVVASVFPAVMMLGGIAGLVVAWRWTHALVSDPSLGPPPGPFAEFRFSDQAVWLLVIGMAGTVAQLSDLIPPAAIWPANLLVLIGGLYVVRGLAVVRAALSAWPGRHLPLLLAGAVFVLFLAPFAVTGLLGIGLADTWLDFRRRAAAASGEPS